MELPSYVEQLRSIERQYAPPEGPEDASAYARQLETWRRQEEDREEVCQTGDATGGWLLMRLCSRYGLKPFRRPRQRATTITLRAPRGFVSKILWPQFQAMARVFATAKLQIASELIDDWLGEAAGDELLILDEEPAEEA